MKLRVCACLIAMALSLPAASAGDTPIVKYDHLNDGSAKSYLIQVAPNKPFVIEIDNTDPERYRYDVAGVPRVPPKGGAAPDEKTKSALQTKQITQVFDPKYGGYIVTIAPTGTPTTVTDAGGGPKQLPTATLIITVEQLQWDTQMSGAFTVSGLRDRVYSIETATENNQQVHYVREDRSAEDRSRLGTGAFIHVFHTRLPWLGGTFGIGINDTSRTTYFAGPAFRFGDKAAVTVGLAAGSVSRLPAGVTVNTPVADANVINNLGSRVAYNWFVGFSFSFLSARSALEKPFAPAEGTAPPASNGPTQP